MRTRVATPEQFYVRDITTYSFTTEPHAPWVVRALHLLNAIKGVMVDLNNIHLLCIEDFTYQPRSSYNQSPQFVNTSKAIGFVTGGLDSYCHGELVLAYSGWKKEPGYHNAVAGAVEFSYPLTESLGPPELVLSRDISKLEKTDHERDAICLSLFTLGKYHKGEHSGLLF